MSRRIKCEKCGSTGVVKAGMINENQRYEYKDCGCQFQPNRQKGKPEKVKRLAILLYLCGLSMRTISKIVKTDIYTVYRWIKTFAENNYEKPEPTLKEVVVELDEMWNYIKTKKTNVEYGKLIIVIPINLSTEGAVDEIMIHLQNSTSD